MNLVDDSSEGKWCVWRLDDNGNEIRMRSGLTRDEADSIASEFTARGHKQTYWVAVHEVDTTGQLDAADGDARNAS